MSFLVKQRVVFHKTTVGNKLEICRKMNCKITIITCLRAYAHAHITGVLSFLLSQVSHMRKKERKREEEFCKTEGWNTRFSMSFRSFMSAQSACLLKLFKMSA